MAHTYVYITQICILDVVCYFYIYVGTYHKYDGMVLPEGTRHWDRGLNVRFISATGKSIPTHDEAQEQCLNVYLRPLKDVLLKCNVQDISSLTSNMLYIFFQLLKPKVYYNKNVYFWQAAGVSKVCVLGGLRTSTLVNLC